MAIVFKSKEDCNYLQVFGVSAGHKAKAFGMGLVVEGVPNALQFKQAGELVGKVTLSVGALSLAVKDELGKISKDHVKHLLEQEIDKIEVLHGGGFVHQGTVTGKMVSSTPNVQEFPKKGSVKFIQKKDGGLVKASETLADTKIDPAAVVPVDMDAPTTVLLRDATKLYQPVKGTGNGSRYFVIAISPELNIAARLKGPTLSLRAEGAIVKYKDQLAACGLSVSESYASVHLKGDNMMVLQRAVGALITGLPLDYTTPMPNVSKLVGKGS